MAVDPTYPGVYVQEVPSGNRTITGVSTSVTAFVGYAPRGPMNEPTDVFNYGEFQREFGGLDPDSALSYAVRQFFLNGGTRALIVRTAADKPDEDAPLRRARVQVHDDPGEQGDEGGSVVFTAAASNPGDWGNRLRLEVDHTVTDGRETFTLRVYEYGDDGTETLRSETFRNLAPSPSGPRYVKKVVDEESDLVRIEVPDSAPADRPAATGTVSSPDADPTDILDGEGNVDVGALGSLGSGDTFELEVQLEEGDKIVVPEDPANPELLELPVEKVDGRPLREFVQELEGALQDVHSALEDATIDRIGGPDGERIRILANTGDPRAIVRMTGDVNGELAESLGLLDANPNKPATSNVQQYSPGLQEENGTDPKTTFGAEKVVLDGDDNPVGEGGNGALPKAAELTGSQREKTGIYALEDADIFNLLCIPRTAELKAPAAGSVLSSALDYCEENRAFMIVDPPKDVDEFEEIREWVRSGVGSRNRHNHAAVYFPRVRIPDPLDEFRPRAISPSGTVAGLYARTDTERGVWKAPAGTEATLRGVHSLEYDLSNAENGVLNPLAVNCLRTFPTYGTVSWGGRTLRGADALADEYKYVPVRRTALFIEESLYRGLQWVVFEPNDESLWAQIRMSVQGFMQTLFRKGAFQGSSPDEAYFVKCDAETTTQADIDRGIVNIVVGFAPLKPAEFVILKIRQMAGQEQ
jgi:phage tail sheath protein FI